MLSQPIEYSKYIVAKINKLSNNLSEVILIPNKDKIKFLPGQYINVYQSNDSDRIIELPFFSYSVASGPNNKELQLIISNGQDNNKINFFINHLNSTITISNGLGHAYFRNHSNNQNIIAIAQGTGIAPIKSIIEYNQLISSKKNFYIYYLCKSREDLLFVDFFNSQKKELNLSCIMLITNKKHHLLYDLLLNNKINLTCSDFYVFGNDGFVLEVYNKISYYCFNNKSEFFSDSKNLN